MHRMCRAAAQQAFAVRSWHSGCITLANMDERRDIEPRAPEALPTPVATEAPVATTPVRKKRDWKGPVGMTAALALAFAWGALTYRELGTGPRPIGPVVAAAVAGSESPPAWVAAFVQAFCDGNAVALAERLGPPLDGQAAEIEQALASREWTCSDTRYLGGGQNKTGDFYAYITVDANGGEQWWVFTVVGEKVVAIE
jgi:hypothetical protein